MAIGNGLGKFVNFEILFRSDLLHNQYKGE